MNYKRSSRAASNWLVVVTILLVTWGCSLLATPAPIYFPTPDTTLTAVFSNQEPSPTSRILPQITLTEVPIPQTPNPSATIVPVEASPTTPPPAVTQLHRGSTPVVATYLPQPPTIDGDLNEWKATSYGIRSVVWGRENWSGEADCSGIAMIGWDQSNLYLAVQVRDDVYTQPASGAYLYLGDSLEILFDTNLEADFTDKQLSSDDYQLGISAGSPLGNRTEAYLWFPRAKEGSYAVEVGTRAAGDGYQVEARIPWTVFNFTPVAGKDYGFALTISDDDLMGVADQQTMVSLAPNRHLTDPTTWVDLILSKP